MRKLALFRAVTFLIFALLISNNSIAQSWLVDPLEALYPDQNPTKKLKKSWKVDIASGGIADVHLLMQLPVGEEFTISAKIDEKVLSSECWSQLVDVPVEQNTGLDSRTEQFIGEINPHVIRRAPFRVFEAIQPVETLSFKSLTNFSAFKFTLPVEFSTNPGVYRVEILVKSQDIEVLHKYVVKVHDLSHPKLEDSDFFYTNWFNLRRMEESHQVERWSDVWYIMLDKYAKLMAHGRQNAITIPGELISMISGEVVLDEKRMLQYINVFRKRGFKYFEAPHLMGRGKEDDWGDPELKVRLTGNRYYKEEGYRDIEKIMIKIKNFTTLNGLTNNWLQHIADEPTSVNGRCYSDAARQIKRIFPEVTIMEATNDRDSIAGAIDIWCPIINDFQENEPFFREREKLGERVLVYTCLVPGGKWLNRTLDMERLRQVYFGWGAAHYNTSGFLHWGLNQYYMNPFEQSVIKHPSPIAGPTNYLPAGDTHIIYPGAEGPLSSVRFEAHRMGCEDFDLLQILKNNNPKLTKKLIGKLFNSYTEYNLNLKTYRRVKSKMLKSILSSDK